MSITKKLYSSLRGTKQSGLRKFQIDSQTCSLNTFFCFLIVQEYAKIQLSLKKKPNFAIFSVNIFRIMYKTMYFAYKIIAFEDET